MQNRFKETKIKLSIIKKRHDKSIYSNFKHKNLIGCSIQFVVTLPTTNAHHSLLVRCAAFPLLRSLSAVVVVVGGSGSGAGGGGVSKGLWAHQDAKESEGEEIG